MANLNDLRPGAALKGVIPGEQVTVVDLKMHGSNVAELTYKDSRGDVHQRLLYRDDEPKLEIVEAGRPWSFEADGAVLRLTSEAYRINLAYLFDPLLAVHTSSLDPLPHQILAVYQEMLPRQPLRFLLADDPGAGKTIMAGLLIKELLIRGDVQRCLICCPGNLVDQWQDELWQKFQLDFSIISRQSIEDSKSGNPYLDKNLVISRLDHMSRNEDIQIRLSQTDWDLIVCDEAHKMSASFFSGEVKETKRYKLGRLLSEHTRHFLLLTATPHNGKEEDFQLFMALLDGDRFEGKFRDGVHVFDHSDLFRRLVKEKLLKFDGTRLLPERKAYTGRFLLSDAEYGLYKLVTDYVREEFNRADALDNDRRRGNVGFALTILQRRLASSPEAIYQSLRRRRERLEKRLREEEILKRGTEAIIDLSKDSDLELPVDFDDFEDAPSNEAEEIEEQIVDRASAARTITELQAEIVTLTNLEKLAHAVRISGQDTKWEKLSELLQDQPEMYDADGQRRKLVVFTEHRDTLNYLAARIRTVIGRHEAVVTIHGGLGREERKKNQESFTQDKEVQILVATDAAGEGINLQRAHLMINYDLPWNPNRLEQRFGRIHRIGQTEVCHLWNLLADKTREGDVFLLLLQKLEKEREALGGSVFDVLGRVFQGADLRKPLIEAIRYGEKPEVQARLSEVVDEAMDRERLRELIEERSLSFDSLDLRKVQEIQQEMERAEATRLQPHYVASFFIEAFRMLGGRISERESKRYEITRVPAAIRTRDREIGIGAPLLPRYERVTFHKELRHIQGKPMAELICPGHPLLDSTIDLILERNRDILKRGAVLVDPSGKSESIRALFYLESRIYDARRGSSRDHRVASRQLQFVEIDEEGKAHMAGYAPYLDYRPIEDRERGLIEPVLVEKWSGVNLADQAESYAIEQLVPRHLSEVRERKEKLLDKTAAAVRDRLTKEINYWDHRAEELKAQELAGKKPRLNSGKARQRADSLETRLQRRMEDIEKERQLSPAPPVIVGGALVIPESLLERLADEVSPDRVHDQAAKERIERAAMIAVAEAERGLGFLPADISSENRGYDIESAIPNSGKLRFIEVKGLAKGNPEVIITRNEILCGLNKPEDFILALCIVDGDQKALRYIQEPFTQEPEFGVTKVAYRVNALWDKGIIPC